MIVIKTIHYTGSFVRKWKKLKNQEQILLEKQIKIFQQNAFEKKLKTHKLKGRLSHLWSFSVNYKLRILFSFKNKDKVIFYDFGSHQIYK